MRATGVDDRAIGRLDLRMPVLAGHAERVAQVGRADVHDVDAGHRRDLHRVLDRVGCLEHHHHGGLVVEHLPGFGRRHRRVAEMRPLVSHRARTQWREAAGVDDLACFRRRLDVRRDNAQRAGIEQAVGMMRVVAGHAHQRGDAGLQRGDADGGGVVLGNHRVLEVDIDRVVAAGLRGQRDVDAAHLLDDHGQPEPAGLQRILQRVVKHGPAPRRRLARAPHRAGT